MRLRHLRFKARLVTRRTNYFFRMNRKDYFDLKESESGSIIFEEDENVGSADGVIFLLDDSIRDFHFQASASEFGLWSGFICFAHPLSCKNYSCVVEYVLEQ